MRPGSAGKAWRRRMQVVEAMILLLAARLLIALVPWRIWRSSLGHRAWAAPAAKDIAWPAVGEVTRAVRRATGRSPIAMACLPRAMAAQWMLVRRGFAPRLIIGVAPPDSAGPAHKLHAWVEVDNRIVIGKHREGAYRAALALGPGAARRSD